MAVIEPVLGCTAERLDLETVGRILDRNGRCGGLQARVDALVDDTRDVVSDQDGGECGG